MQTFISYEATPRILKLVRGRQRGNASFAASERDEPLVPHPNGGESHPKSSQKRPPRRREKDSTCVLWMMNAECERKINVNDERSFIITRTQASAAQWDEDQHRIGIDKSAGGAAIQASDPVGHLRLCHK